MTARRLASGSGPRFDPARVVRGARIAVIALACAVPAGAKVFLSQAEALHLAFPEGTAIERHTTFLTAAQQAAVQKRTKSERPPSALVTSYVGTRNGRVVGTAYFDTHRVRTQPETLMVLVSPEEKISRIEVLSFDEPEEYLPREHWYAQFPGKGLDEDLVLNRGVRAVSGATLTARATTEAARRILALHQVLAAEAAPAPAPTGTSGTHAR